MASKSLLLVVALAAVLPATAARAQGRLRGFLGRMEEVAHIVTQPREVLELRRRNRFSYEADGMGTAFRSTGRPEDIRALQMIEQLGHSRFGLNPHDVSIVPYARAGSKRQNIEIQTHRVLPSDHRVAELRRFISKEVGLSGRVIVRRHTGCHDDLARALIREKLPQIKAIMGKDAGQLVGNLPIDHCGKGWRVWLNRHGQCKLSPRVRNRIGDALFDGHQVEPVYWQYRIP
jgi:hypothetical protein